VQRASTGRTVTSARIAGDFERIATMSKGLDKRREAKKKPAKSLQEKRAAKRAKKEGGSAPPMPS